MSRKIMVPVEFLLAPNFDDFLKYVFECQVKVLSACLSFAYFKLASEFGNDEADRIINDIISSFQSKREEENAHES